MFEHFRSFFAKAENRTTMMLIGGFIILLIVLKHFGIYEGFTPFRTLGEKRCKTNMEDYGKSKCDCESKSESKKGQ